MSKPFYESSKFKKLSAMWEKKLRDSGFRDIESDYDKKNGTGEKKNFRVDPVRISYYRKCEALLQSTKIQNELDRFIFEKHCEGLSNREIAKLLPDSGLKVVSHDTVNRRILSILKLGDIKPIVFKF